MQNKECPLDLSEIHHIERITVGKVNPADPTDDAQIQSKMNQINELLSGVPKGILIGKDISFSIVKIGEHSVACQQVSYHIGFKRKPKL